MQWFRCMFHVDIEHCGVCGGTLRVIAYIERPEVIERSFVHLATRHSGGINDPPAPPMCACAA